MRLLLALLFSLSIARGAEVVEPAALMLEGQTLFTFRTPVGSISPVERVKLISARLHRLQADRTFDLNRIVTHHENDLGWQILAGENLLLVITPKDEVGEGHTGKVIAETIAFRLKEILSDDRQAKSPTELLIHSLYALLYTLGLVLLLWALNKLYNFSKSRLLIWEGTLIRSLQIKTFEILPAARITKLSLWLLSALKFTTTITLFYFYIPLVLALFPWTAHYSTLLLGYVTTPLWHILNAFVAFIPNLFFIVINLLVTRYALKLIRTFFTEIEVGNLKLTGFYSEWARPTFQLVRIFVVAFSVVVIFPYIPGSGSPAFQGISVFLGVIVSFGSSSAMANVISGLVLTYMRSFRIGDRVKIAEAMGDVVETTLLVTRIRTVKNVEITIPNSLVLNSHMLNFSTAALNAGLILHTEVTIGYDASWRKVHELLIGAALKTNGILSEPAPFVYQSGLDDSYVRYEINAYTRVANRMAGTYSELRQHIQDAFNEAGVEIMSPSYSAIRDGNTVTIPPDKRPEGYTPSSFRIDS